MNNFYLALLGTIALTPMFAQTSKLTGQSSTGHSFEAQKPLHLPLEKDAGDTIFYFSSIYYVSAGTVDFQTEDLDGLSTYYGQGATADFDFYWSTDVVDFFPWDVDTAFYISATSWFLPAGQADNWLEFGPIDIPANGATLSWYVRSNPGYRDGYEVLASETGMSFTEFNAPAFYSRSDLFPAPDADTVWTLVTADVPSSHNGHSVYFAFHHNANDMDVLDLDEFTLTEKAGNASIQDHLEWTGVSIYPNPANDFTTFSLNTQTEMEVELTIYDAQGKRVSSRGYYLTPGTQQITVDVSDWAEGIYSYKMVSGSMVANGKLSVTR